jgi:hypothetical protein
MWQMDAGPLLLPLPGAAAAAARASERPVAGLGAGYLVFNRVQGDGHAPDRIEAVARPVPRGGADAAGDAAEGAGFFTAPFVLEVRGATILTPLVAGGVRQIDIVYL